MTKISYLFCLLTERKVFLKVLIQKCLQNYQIFLKNSFELKLFCVSLQLWKRALEDVKESSKNLDAETLFVSLEKLRSLSLVDEFGHQDYGEAILSILTVGEFLVSFNRLTVELLLLKQKKITQEMEKAVSMHK